MTTKENPEQFAERVLKSHSVECALAMAQKEHEHAPTRAKADYWLQVAHQLMRKGAS